MRLTLFFFFILMCVHTNAQRVCSGIKYANTNTLKEIRNQSNAVSRDTLRDEVISIPVVFHVLYNNAIQNISDAQILSQLQILNDDFRRANADAVNTPAVFQRFAADTKIKFCIAKSDELGRPTNGIIRKSTHRTVFSIDDAMKFNATGGDNAWDCTRYLNIWVCNLGASNLGYATQPGDPIDVDGVVIQYNALGKIGNLQPNFNKGRTATHEVAHWLGLKHLWGDNDCGDDHIFDTPQQSTYNNGCPNFPHMSSCSPNGNGDMFMNFMDYSNDACMNLFTNGQRNAMRSLFALNGPRNSFLNSTACDSITSSGASLPTEITPSEPTFISKSSVRIFPNPVQQDLNIIALNGYELKGKRVMIFTVTGIKVISTTLFSDQSKINLSNLSSGVYFLKIEGDTDQKSHKIIKL
jgi:hypothetical protein